MQRRHKTLIAVGLVIFLLGWFAWSVLLTEARSWNRRPFSRATELLAPRRQARLLSR